MTGPSATAETKAEKRTLLKSVLTLVAVALISLTLFILVKSYRDPYVLETLSLRGSEEQGVQLFRMNCVGCHGIAARGLLGPDLHEVTTHRSDREIINQVIRGKTPPMPRFEMEPQSMADILAYLNSLS